MRQIWNSIPLRRQVRGAYWSVPGNTIPTGRDDIGDWLFDQWAEIDAWISENRSAVYEPGGAARPPG